ncbi:MAG: ABC transporter permease [Rhizomicrobium sp.]
MFRNYLLVALRNASRNKLYSLITIGGLTLALSCAIFIMMFVSDELSYDRFIPDMRDVYRVDFGFALPGRDIQRSANTMFILGPTMKAEIPQVIAYTHINPVNLTVKTEHRLFAMDADVVDPNFFQVIHLHLLAGTPSRVFAQPDSVVLSQRVATKLFGQNQALGRILVINGKHPMTVTGIVQNLPHNSQLVASIIFPNTSKADPTNAYVKDHWETVGPLLYVKLARGSRPGHIVQLMRQILNRNVNASDFGANIPGSQLIQPHLTRFYRVHLSEYGGGMTPGGRWSEIYGFVAIAGLILLIASFNFTNMATARGIMRAREVSLRKVHGARRSQLVRQFLGESVLTAFMALCIALALIELLTPAYDTFLGRQIAFDVVTDWPLTLVVLGLTLMTGILGGIYPAFVLSRYRPATAMRTSAAQQSGSGKLRVGLVVLQFAVSIGLGIAALVVFLQIHYAQKINLGFARSNIVVIRNANDIPQDARRDFIQTLRADPAIASATLSGDSPFAGSISLQDVTVKSSPQVLSVRLWQVGFHYPDVYRTKLLAGRQLSSHRSNDVLHHKSPSTNILVSASAAHRFGFTPEGAIGQTLHMGKRSLTIVGVLANQDLDGPEEQTYPTIFVDYGTSVGKVAVRIRAGQTRAALAAIDHAWVKFAPNAAINRYFLDDPFNRLFKTTEQRDRMFAVFVIIAILIACLGLYGLAAFTAQRRIREIGVRKVFGARTPDIMLLLLWQFSTPVLLANVVAWPVSWFYLQDWLQHYSHRIALSPIYFVGSGFAALAIAWITVGAHALQAARTKPAHTLHYE